MKKKIGTKHLNANFVHGKQQDKIPISLDILRELMVYKVLDESSVQEILLK